MEEDTTTGSTELKAGKVIANRWKIVEKLGAGEMGIVYRVGACF
jgi:hypothetical protein